MNFWTMNNVLQALFFLVQISKSIYNHIDVDVWMAGWVCFKFIMSLS